MWPLGASAPTEQFLPGGRGRAARDGARLDRAGVRPCGALVQGRGSGADQAMVGQTVHWGSVERDVWTPDDRAPPQGRNRTSVTSCGRSEGLGAGPRDARWKHGFRADLDPGFAGWAPERNAGSVRDGPSWAAGGTCPCRGLGETACRALPGLESRLGFSRAGPEWVRWDSPGDGGMPVASSWTSAQYNQPGNGEGRRAER